MERKFSIIIMVLLVLSLITNIALLIVLSARGDITGFSTKAANAGVAGQQAVFEGDAIEINKADLNKCCSFINAKGEEDGCYVLKNYDCAFCSGYCR